MNYLSNSQINQLITEYSPCNVPEFEIGDFKKDGSIELIHTKFSYSLIIYPENKSVKVAHISRDKCSHYDYWIIRDDKSLEFYGRDINNINNVYELQNQRIKLYINKINLLTQELSLLQEKNRLRAQSVGRKKKFSSDERSVILTKIEQGQSISSIAKEYDTTRSTIYKLLNNDYKR